jgi:hypothetical protein
MAKKRGRLRLVSSHDPASVFDDLDALRRAQTTPAGPAFQGQRRQRSVETFARIPHDRARILGSRNPSGTVWRILIELDRLIFEARGKNPVKLTHRCLKAAGLTRFAAMRALHWLEIAGIISVERQHGQAPLVTHRWFPAS